MHCIARILFPIYLVRFLCCKDRRIAKMLKSLRAYGFRPYLYRRCNADCSPAFKARCVKGKIKVSSIQLHLALLIAAKMSNHSGHYSIEELLALRESPLVSKPETLPQMEQWMQPAMDRRALQNAQPQYFSFFVPLILHCVSTGNGESDPKFRATESRRARICIPVNEG